MSDDVPILNSEEDVTAKILVPWLKERGFDPSELEFERGFSIRLGRGVFKVGGDEQERARGRADILVKRAGVPLFVVEVKASGEPLGDDERDQAISYARLVDQPAPYAVVTDGTEWRVFDVLTKEPAEISSDSKFELILDDDARNEAVAAFIGFSTANVKQLCRQVTEYYSAPVLANGDQTARLLPTTYVSRGHADERLDRFLEEETQVLAVIAESGMGKTCWLCESARRLQEDGRATLYFRALDVRDGVSQTICREAGWVFSAAGNEQQTFKRILRVLAGAGGLTIFLDDIDLIPIEDARKLVERFLNDIRGLGERADSVRLVLGTNQRRMEQLARVNDQPTQFGLALTAEAQVSLDKLSPVEFSELLRLHRKEFGFYGQIDDAMLARFRANLFFMRVAIEVATAERHRTMSQDVVAILKTFAQRQFGRFESEFEAKAFLAAIAGRMLEQGADSLPVAELWELKGGLNASALVEEALRLKLLLADDEEDDISFHQQLFQDFVAAFLATGWPRKSSDEFAASLQDLPDAEPKRRALNLYAEHASEEQLGVVAPRATATAIAAHEEYEKWVGGPLAGFRNCLPPYSDLASALVVADLASDTVGAVGFVPRTNPERVRVLTGRGRNVFDDIAGGRIAYLTFGGEFDPDSAQRTTQSTLRSGLSYAFQQGFDDGATTQMLTERCLTLAYDLLDHFRPELDPLTSNTRWTIGQLREEVRFHAAYSELSRLLAIELGDSATAENPDGRTIQVTFNRLDEAQKAKLTDEAREVARSGKLVAPHSDVHRLDAWLDELENEGVSGLKWPVVRTVDNDRPQSKWQLWTTGTLRAMLLDLYREAFEGYRSIVDANFAPIASEFSLYAAPLELVVRIDDGGAEPADIPEREPHVTASFIAADVPTVRLTDERIEFHEDGTTTLAGEPVKLVREHGGLLGEFFTSSHYIYRGPRPELTPLLHLAYELVWHDLSAWVDEHMPNDSGVR